MLCRSTVPRRVGAVVSLTLATVVTAAGATATKPSTGRVERPIAPGRFTPGGLAHCDSVPRPAQISHALPGGTDEPSGGSAGPHLSQRAGATRIAVAQASRVRG